MSYLLIHRSPGGKVGAHTTVFDTVEEAARTSILYSSDVRNVAATYAADLATQCIGSIVEHPGGYAFRVLPAHFTADRLAITPGMKVRVGSQGNTWTGIVEPQQFMATGLLSPGSVFFDGYFLVLKGNKPEAKYAGPWMNRQELAA